MNALSRRTFLGSLTTTALSALGAPDRLHAASGSARAPMAFSTLGCPAWDWKTVLAEAETLGFAALELRGIQGEMDLTKRPELAGDGLKATRTELAGRGLSIACLGSSARMHEGEAAARAVQLDEGRRFIDLAHALGAPYVRVFGDALPQGPPRAAVLARVVAGFRELGGHAQGSGVTVLIESHGDFTRSADLAEVLETVALPEVALLWDAHHTFVAAHEAPAETFARLGRFIRHTHLKDSRPAGDGRRYVLTGTGDVPVRETVRVLASGGYRGLYCFEWEKKWHPEIEEPEVAFAHYARTMREYLAAAGAR